MSGKEDSSSDKGGRWRRLPELPEEIFDIWQKPDGELNPSSVVATVDADGKPRVAPFGSLRAVTPRLLRLISLRHHDTYANLARDGRVMVSLLSPPNLAVGVSGRARVVREKMSTDERFAVIDIDVDEVKNDMPFRIDIESAINISPQSEFSTWWSTVWKELEKM
ncbi:MAG: pyridoxamine 5'-phosphate oxidase family protein [Candidatus Thorarchaeota archaeon]|nr:MAG: pyridoxamine 5'-phosphate oxidase family protein [Candidatus Thorarchaeota archaeon]